MAKQYDFPWCCFGDFNEILWDHEKSGHNLRRERKMIEFREALKDCMLEDLRFIRSWYMWEKGRQTTNNK